MNAESWAKSQYLVMIIYFLAAYIDDNRIKSNDFVGIIGVVVNNIC